MRLSSLLAGVAIAATATVLHAAGPAGADWPSYGNDQGAKRYSTLTQITPENVSKLQVAWTYHMRPADYVPPPMPANLPATFKRTGFSSSQATPIVIKGVMYFPSPYGKVVALDADTGKELWAYTLPERDQASTRGVQYWPGSGRAKPEIVFGTRSGRLIALAAATGVPVPGFGEDGVVDMKTPEIMNGNPRSQYGMSGPPAIYGDLIITGSRVQETPSLGAKGDVRAWDARSGKLVWTFHTVPQPGEFGNDSWEGDSWKGRSGVNVWTQIVVDEKRGIAYLPVAAPSFDRWGGDRKGNNLFGNSIVAVDANNGKYLWHFQVVHHDIWDVDLPAATLIDVKKNGRTIPAIAVMSKMAIMFMLDRVTGKPIYDVTEVPVPTDTDIPGEHPSPTQPMPSAPPPLTRLSFEMADLAAITPEMKERCQKVVDDYHVVPSKMFQPLRADSAVAFFPGSLGGIDYGGGAFDPRLGLYITNVNSLASPQQLAKQANGSWDLARGYAYLMDRETRTPCGPPPWGEMIAVDVNSGRIAWRRPLGTTDSLPEGKRDTGRLSSGAPIATVTGLAFFGSTDENKMRAFDTRTGEIKWTAPLPAAIYGSTITYQGNSGRQFVAAVDTGGFNGSPVTSDEVIAFALPK
uniref:outer membrane protein assembly factor BamB family protein n=1 Tax=Sphingomonas bacterium TaxID=1895847 RepID=UPI002612FFBE|nr:PQQ-binding-like beta-propeller repeat protein [Sphingomonas bacterium]